MVAVSIYGWVTPTRQQRAQLDDYLVQLLDFWETRGKPPMVIGGDLNLPWEELMASAWFGLRGWGDAAATEPTCRGAAADAPTKRDALLVSPG